MTDDGYGRARLALVGLALLGLVLAGLVQSAAAQDATPIPADPLVCFPRGEAATLLSSYAEAPLLRAQVATLEQDLALKDRQLDAYAKLQALDEQIIAKEQRLRTLAENERDVFKDQKDRAEGKNRWLKCGAGAGFGALAGSAVMPPFGTAAGAILGCLAALLGL